MKTLRASFFQSHVSDIDQNKNSTFFCCTGIGAGCSTKKQLAASFAENTSEKIMKIQYASTSSFHNPKLS